MLMGAQQMEGVIRESILFKEDHNDILRYSYLNDNHAAHLIHMPISESNGRQMCFLLPWKGDMCQKGLVDAMMPSHSDTGTHFFTWF